MCVNVCCAQIADIHRWMGLSVFQTYAGGLANIEPSHLNTPFAGTYGCPLDYGVSPPGLLAHNYRSDRRQHGYFKRLEPTNNSSTDQFN